MGAGASSRSKQQATEVASEAAPSRARVANLGSQTSKQSTHNIDRLERGVEAQADALSMYGQGIDQHRYGGYERGMEADEHEDNEDELLSQADSEDREELEQAAAMFASATMSLEMDNDDLLFNLMYFGGDETPGGQTLGGSLNTALEEVVASHSAGNTAYKLRPVSESISERLTRHAVELTHEHMREEGKFCLDNNTTAISNETECQICKDGMECQQHVILLPACRHIFHRDCLLRWVTLQDWCPVCRTNVDQNFDRLTSAQDEAEARAAAVAAVVDRQHDEDGTAGDAEQQQQQQQHREKANLAEKVALERERRLSEPGSLPPLPSASVAAAAVLKPSSIPRALSRDMAEYGSPVRVMGDGPEVPA